MLRIVNDNKLGSHPVMTKPVEEKPFKLDYPSHAKRVFAKENPTETPKFNSCKPKLYVPPNPNLTPNKDNGYNNNYHKSTTRMDIITHESAINAMYRPAPYS